MRRLPIAVALSLVLVASCADESGDSAIGPPTGPLRGVTLRAVEFCSAAGSDLLLDLHLPTEQAGPRVPVALFLHGGGWTSGTRDDSRWLGLLREPLLARGIAVATADYRLAPEHRWPAQLEDAKCAVRFLRASAERFGFDSDAIGVWGSSAGGHLAAMLGTTEPGAFEGDGGHPGVSSRVRAVVDLWGPADLTSREGWPRGHEAVFRLVFGTSDPGSPVLAAASPVSHVTADDSPFLILHGDEDVLVPLQQSRALADRLDAAGVEARLVVVEGGDHGLTPRAQPFTPSRNELIGTIAAFLEARLR